MILCTIFLFVILYKVFEYGKGTEDRKRMKLAFWTTVILIFLSGFRNLGVGIDTAYYIVSLKEASRLSFSDVFSSFLYRYFNASNETKDPGFLIFEKIFSIITTNPTLYLLSIGTFFLISLKKFLLKYTATSWELVFSFVVYLTLFWGYLPNAAIRQSVAMVILLYVYSNFDRIKWHKGVLLLFFASFIHQSILAGLVIYLFPMVKNIKTYYIMCGILFVGMFFIGSLFVSSLASFSDVYSSYADSDYYTSGNAKPYNFIILMLLIYVIGLVRLKDERFVNQNIFLFKMMGVSIILTPLILVQPNLQRLTAMFAISTCAFLPRCLSMYSTIIRRTIYVILFLVFMRTTSKIQYKFNWQHMELHDRYLYMDIKN